MLAGSNVVPFTAGRSTGATPGARPIEHDGLFLGAAVSHELGVRFIAGDVRVTDMDQSIWPTVEYAERSARQLFRASRTRTKI
jgi:hypothetical protein